MLIYLVRHGETLDNTRRAFLGQRDPPLTARGRAEADTAAALLAPIGIDRVVSSDLTRAEVTATRIATLCDAPLVIDPRLRELDLGRLDGISLATAEEQFADVLDAWRVSPATCRMPDGERLSDLQERMWAALVDHIGQAGEGVHRLALVSHTFALLALLCRMLDIPLDRFRRFHLNTGSVSVVRARFEPTPVFTLEGLNLPGICPAPSAPLGY